MKALRTLLAVFLVAIVFAVTSTSEEAAANHCSNLVTTLSGQAIDGVDPSGKGNWRGNDLCNLGLELKVEVRDVNLPNGTVVTFTACTDPATGQVFQRDLTLSGGAARFELRRSDGDAVPHCERGTPVRVLHAGSTILSGTWCAPVVTKCR